SQGRKRAAPDDDADDVVLVLEDGGGRRAALRPALGVLHRPPGGRLVDEVDLVVGNVAGGRRGGFGLERAGRGRGRGLLRCRRRRGCGRRGARGVFPTAAAAGGHEDR